MNLTFSLDDTAVQKKLGRIASGIKDFRKPFGRAGDDLLKVYGKDVFETQGRASGVRWKPLAEATLRARAEARGHYARRPEVSGKILWWTGALKRGFEKQVKKELLRIHNTIPYFKYHQTRGGRPPQRKMLFLNARVIRIAVERVAEHVFGLVRS